MKRIEDVLDSSIHTIGIAGHINPDGDCIGSTTGLYLYITENYPEYQVDLYLEEPKPLLQTMTAYDKSIHEVNEPRAYDLFITCDTSEKPRIALAGGLFEQANKTVCIDHHVSNPGFAQVNHIVADASSCAEVLADLMDPVRISVNTATNLYTGIVHDTGVFQYTNTTPHTMEVAAGLMRKGVRHSQIIDRTFNIRSYDQNRILGYALEKSEQRLGGRLVVSSLTIREMNRYGVTLKDLDCIVSQLRLTEGAEGAVFAYEKEPGIFKISLRSNTYLDVAKAAAEFGGGGHVHAAGCTLKGEANEVLRKVVDVLEDYMEEP
ncbi:MAG: bifunctional oligoribonuclease/PAP phosphatase NrnA [Lachnospiraceae bacterium]|nr:bifunctional oligoribonuclease/PAP phosphatase NrnA [Lachnospiraceae bacterium]